MDIVNRDRVTPFETKDTSTIRELLNPRNSAARAQSLAEATLPPGATTQAHYHPCAEELYYVLSGTAEMRLEDETKPLTAGDAVVIPPGHCHQIRNSGQSPLIFLCCCAPRLHPRRHRPL